MHAFSTTVERIPEGTQLAQPVLDSHGQMLLPAGATLSLGMLRGLEQRGIPTVFVTLPEGSARESTPHDPAAARAQIEERLQHLFRSSRRDGQINPLFHLILQFRAGGKP